MGLILIIHSYSVYAYNTMYVALKNLQGACRYWSILQLFAVEPNLDRFRHTVFASYLTESQIFCFKEDRWISVCRWATSSNLSWSRMILSTQTVAPAGSDTPMPALFMFIYAAGLGVSANHLKPLPGVHVWIETFFLSLSMCLWRFSLSLRIMSPFIGFQAEITMEGIRCSQRRMSTCINECKAETSTWEEFLGPYQSLQRSIPHHTHSSPINTSVPNGSRICKWTHGTSPTHKHTGKQSVLLFYHFTDLNVLSRAHFEQYLDSLCQTRNVV